MLNSYLQKMGHGDTGISVKAQEGMDDSITVNWNTLHHPTFFEILKFTAGNRMIAWKTADGHFVFYPMTEDN